MRETEAAWAAAVFLMVPAGVFAGPPDRVSSAAGAPGEAASAAAPRYLLGIVDTGVDSTAPELRGSIVAIQDFAVPGGQEGPNVHGTAVAAIAASNGARLLVANVFNRDRSGAPVARVGAIARAVDWLVAMGAPVINISITGPPNPLLEDAIKRAIAKGHVIVAAAGEGGRGGPSYPAAYPGVIAVTAVDYKDRIYWKANAGSYVGFAAFGVGVPVRVAGQTTVLSGTSFASPVVAAMFARQMPVPSRDQAARLTQQLRLSAIDLGAPGWDPIYGWGRVGPKGQRPAAPASP